MPGKGTPELECKGIVFESVYFVYLVYFVVLNSGTRNVRHCFYTPPTDGGMLRVRAYVGLPMPATLAFLTVGFGDGCEHCLAAFLGQLNLRNVQ
jgi:hypothetical protein